MSALLSSLHRGRGHRHSVVGGRRDRELGVGVGGRVCLAGRLLPLVLELLLPLVLELLLPLPCNALLCGLGRRDSLMLFPSTVHYGDTPHVHVSSLQSSTRFRQKCMTVHAYIRAVNPIQMTLVIISWVVTKCLILNFQVTNTDSYNLEQSNMWHHF